MTPFGIYRILGNELPPRDKPGKRIEVLKTILDREPPFPGVEKWYILNSIHDVAARARICDVLNAAGAHYVVLPANKGAFQAAKTHAEKLQTGIDINNARNYAINWGQRRHRFTILLDGDCFFDPAEWEQFAAFITADQASAHPQTCYTIPLRRQVGESVDHIGEPMLAFRDDCGARFDDKIPFGMGDKIKFLEKLGHTRPAGGDWGEPDPTNPRNCGFVRHLGTGDNELELDDAKRQRFRAAALELFPSRAQNLQRNDYYKTVHGFFDFEGFYSGLAMSLPNGAHFVEVGCWFGKSIIYLATQAKLFGKTMQFDAVDPWDGRIDIDVPEAVRKIIDAGQMLATFKRHLLKSGVDDVVMPIPMISVEAATLYQDNSLDAVFIDADHSYGAVMEDLTAWYPKVKPGGIIAGHDYKPGHPVSDAGVVKAVDEFFADKSLELRPGTRLWKHVKR